MARLSELAFAELSREQQEVLGSLPSARRAVLTGPNAVLIHLPDVCASVRDLSARLRSRSRIEKRLFELAVLTVARAWSVQYMWFVHESDAQQAGLSNEIITAIRRGDEAPPFENEKERIVFLMVRELQKTTRIADITYARALAVLGHDVLIELVSVVGFYNMIAVVLNAFEVSIPDGQVPLLSEPTV